MGEWYSRACALLMTAIVLAGCSSIGDFRSIPEEGPSIFVNGSLAAVQSAAVEALAEARLASPQTERTPDGVRIFAEQTALVGAVFNSYGGFGKVTIKRTASPNTFSVAVITRSRVAGEPVGKQDVLKGYNYNDPQVATGVLHRISELIKQKNP